MHPRAQPVLSQVRPCRKYDPVALKSAKGSVPATYLISNGREKKGRSWADRSTQHKRVWHVFVPQALEVVVDGLTKILWCTRGKKHT